MIVLNDSMLIGIPHVDNQHKTLVNAINNFIDSCNQGKGRKQIEDTLIYVASYTQEHFKDEERIQEKCGFPGAAAHKRIHSQFIIQANALVKKFHNEGPTIVLVSELNKALVDWVINHIKTEDKKVGEYIISSGKKISA